MPNESELKKLLLERNQEESEFYVDLDSHLAKQYANVQKIKFELQNVKETAHILYSIESNGEILSTLPFDEHKKRLIRQSLCFSIIISYAKCFSDASKGKGRTKLEKKDHLKQAEKDLSSLHDTIIAMRNTYIAHGGENEFEELQTRLYLYGDSQTGDISGKLGHFGVKQFSFSKEDLINITKLIDIILSNIELKINKLWKKVMDEVESKPIENWIKRANKK